MYSFDLCTMFSTAVEEKEKFVYDCSDILNTTFHCIALHECSVCKGSGEFRHCTLNSLSYVHSGTDSGQILRLNSILLGISANGEV